MSDYEGNDIYCDLIVPGKLEIEIIKETDRIIAFHHMKPYWPVHIVVIPKRHIDSFLDLGQKYAITSTALLTVVSEIAKQVTEEHGAARVITNLGKYQDSKHVHFHICFGEPLVD